MIEHMFLNCGLAIEDYPLPDGTMGKQIVIFEMDSSGQPSSVYRYPMDEDQANTTGTKLMGLGRVHPPSAADIANLGNGNGHNSSKGRHVR